MSGTSLLIRSLPYEMHEENYQKAMVALGLENASAEDRVKALLEMPGQALVTKLPSSVRFVPALDGDFIQSGVTYAEVVKRDSAVLPGKGWCKELLIGDAEVDVCWPLISAASLANQHDKSRQASLNTSRHK